MNFSERLLNAANEGAKTKMEKDKKKLLLSEFTDKSCQGNIHKTGMDEIWTCFDCLIENVRANERIKIAEMLKKVESELSWDFEVQISKIITELKGK
jgi:hypothetical protein